jgi:hypothetical protein
MSCGIRACSRAHEVDFHRCPVIIGNSLVYLDHSHVSFAYSRALEPVIGALADRARGRLTCRALLATPSTTRVRHGGAGNHPHN